MGHKNVDMMPTAKLLQIGSLDFIWFEFFFFSSLPTNNKELSFQIRKIR